MPEPELPALYAEYRSANSNPIDALIGPWVRVGNRGTGQACRSPSSSYATTSRTKRTHCACANASPSCTGGVLPGGRRVPAKLEYVTSGWLTGYLELSFMPERAALRPGEYMEAQLEFHTGDYQQLDETNDFSFDAAYGDFAEFRRVAVYRGDQLVWGDVPIW